MTQGIPARILNFPFTILNFFPGYSVVLKEHI